MTRATEGGTYLGGISTMLIQTDVCPSCGGTHGTKRLGFPLRGNHACPAIVFGSLPILTEQGIDTPAEFDGSELSELGAGVYPGGLPSPRPTERRSSAMSVPWPMPQEEFL
jgi:hypothetical protein